MATDARIREGWTLKQFLQRKDIDEKPYLMFIDGRVEVKVSPLRKHGKLTQKSTDCFNLHAIPGGIGEAFPELRCTFGGHSMIPDVAFLLDEHNTIDTEGEYEDQTYNAPDIHVEILSPKQSQRASRASLTFSVAHGCLLGILVDPKKKTIQTIRPGGGLEFLPPDGVIDCGPALPGLQISVAEVFGWLIRRPPPQQPPGEAG